MPQLELRIFPKLIAKCDCRTWLPDRLVFAPSYF